MKKSIGNPKAIVKISGIIISALVVAFIVYVFVLLFIPSEKYTVAQILNETYGTEIFEEWEKKKKNTESAKGFHHDGTAYYVFDTDGRNEKFLSDFVCERDEAFEKTFREEMKNIVFSDARFIPSFAEPYEWRKILLEKTRDDCALDSCYAKRLYMLFNPSQNYLYVMDIRL